MIWVAILCCLLVSFVFSGIEAGILSVNRVRLNQPVMPVPVRYSAFAR